MSLANKFNIPPALFETIKKMNEGKEEYQAKVKALMAKRGIKSLADLSPEEKKDFFNTLDSMHKAKNEEIDLEEAKKPVSKDDVTKLLVKYGNNPQSAKKMVDKEFDSAVKRHPEASASKIAEVIRSVAEEVELEEAKSGTGYDLYHKDFSSAMQHAYDFAKKKYGIEIDPTEIDRNVAMGPRKPGSGKANAYRLLDKTGKKAIQVQVANLDNKRYELNMYKEEVEQIDEISLKDRLAGKTAPVVKSKYNRTKANRPMTGKELERHNKSKQLAFEKMPAPEHTKGYTLKHKSTHEVEGELGDATDHYYHILKDGKKVGEHYFAGYFGHGTVRLHGNEETDTGYIGSTERLQHWMKTKAGFRSVFGKKEGEQKHAEYVAKHGVKKHPNMSEEVEQIDEISADVAKRVAQARDRSAVANKVTSTQSRRMKMGDKGGDPDMNAGKALKSAMKRGAKDVYKEEVELDEVLDTPSKTLGYLAKATVSGLKSGALGTGKFRKRQAGIQAAVRKTKEKIANEEVEQIEEGMSAAQIKKLRDAYGNIDKIDVSGQPYKNLVAFLDKQNLDTLKMLAGAKIKFISPLAQNRVIRKMNESIGSSIGRAIGQYAGSKMGLEGPGGEHGALLGRQLEMFARAMLKKLTKEEIELTESDFKIGDDVICKDSGMEGEVVKIDEPQTGKYYTVKREDGKMVKYAPDELKAEDEDEDEEEDDEKEDMEEASSPAQQAAIAIAMKKAGKTPKNEEVEELDEISAETAKSVAQKRDLHFRKGTPTETQKRRMGRGDWRADPSLHADKARQSAEKRGAKDVYDYNKKEEVEFDEASNPQVSMKRAGLSVERAKEVMRHQKEIGTIRKKREALRNSYDPSIIEAYKKMKNKKKEVTKDDNQIVKSSDKLSGKQEPIELEPELKEQKS